MNASLLALSLSLTQAPVAPAAPVAPQPQVTVAPEAHASAAQAAERAAVAAEAAAKAAQSAAETVAKLAQAQEDRAKAAAAAAAPAAVEAKKEEEKKDDAAWSGNVGLSLISLTGNANTLTFTANGAVERKSSAWVFGLKGSASYGQARPTDETVSQVTALAAGLQGRADKRLSETVNGYLLGGAETDHVKSVEFRGYGEGGGAIQWLDVKDGDLSKLALKMDIGLRYSDEQRFQYYPDPKDLERLVLVAPRVGVSFRYALTKSIIFTENLEALVNLWGDTRGRVLANSTTTLAAKLTDSLSLNTSFLVAHDSVPAAGKVATDTTLQFGLGWSF